MNESLVLYNILTLNASLRSSMTYCDRVLVSNKSAYRGSNGDLGTNPVNRASPVFIRSYWCTLFVEEKGEVKMEKVITFGEIMLRLSTPAFRRFQQADSFDVTYGGAEANVSSSLSGLGLDSFFVTVLPDNDIGSAALAHLRKYDIKTEYINPHYSPFCTSLIVIFSGISERVFSLCSLCLV